MVPTLSLSGLDILWIQVAGTLCNLRCAHCLVSSGPGDDRHAMMPREDVLGLVAEASARGVREVYFTGGEPLLHPDIEGLCESTLERLPLTVLTNGMLVSEARAARFGSIFARARFSLEIRVSLDAMDPEANDRIRGRGNFEAAVEGIRRLVRHGLHPIVTTVELEAGLGSPQGRAALLAFLARLEIPRPRLKILPLFPVGREVDRSGPAPIRARLREGDLDGDALARLPCATSRIVTSRGVYACPIRIDDPDAFAGETLDVATGPIRLSSPACYTCHASGATCAT